MKIENGKSPSGLPVNHGKAIASAFAGLTVDQFLDYVAEFKKLPEPGYDGNTNGDFSMLKYTTANNKYKSLGYMVCCDDLDRENSNLTKAENMVKTCEENGWTPISMKNDWTTIYGEGVTYKK